MTLYSRYLLLNFCRLFALALGTMVAMILISRLTVIAEFATYGVPLTKLLEFIVIQIPLFLPTAIPISALIATFILMRRLSHNGELTAFRSAGLSLSSLLFPILAGCAFLSILSFYITSEVGTYTHRRTRAMIKEVTALNPILMLEHPSIANMTGAYTKMDPVYPGREVENVFVALPGRRINLLFSDHLKIKEGQLQGTHMTTVTQIPHKEGFDHLIVENLEATYAPAVELATLVHKKGWKLACDHLSWRLLTAMQQRLSPKTDGKSQMRIKKCTSEKGRRLCLASLPLFFAFLGLTYGFSMTRSRSFLPILTVALLTVYALIINLVAKELDHLPLLSISLFSTPHLLIALFTLMRMRNINRGAVK